MTSFPKPRTLRFFYSKEPHDTNCASQRSQLVWDQGRVCQQGDCKSSGLTTLLWYESRLAALLNPNPIQPSWLLWSPLLPRSSQINMALELLPPQPQHKGYNWTFTSVLAAQEKSLVNSIWREWAKIQKTVYQTPVLFLQLTEVFLGLPYSQRAWVFSPFLTITKLDLHE